MAQSLVDNSQTNRRIELHAVHPSPLVATDKGPSVAQFCAAATGPPDRSAWGIIPPPLTLFVSAARTRPATPFRLPRSLTGERSSFPDADTTAGTGTDATWLRRWRSAPCTARGTPPSRMRALPGEGTGRPHGRRHAAIQARRGTKTLVRVSGSHECMRSCPANCLW